MGILANGVKVDSMRSKCVSLSKGDHWVGKVYNRDDGLDKIVRIPD